MATIKGMAGSLNLLADPESEIQVGLDAIDEEVDEVEDEDEDDDDEEEVEDEDGGGGSAGTGMQLLLLPGAL